MTRLDAIEYSKPPHHIKINLACLGVVQAPMTMNEIGEVSERLKNAINFEPIKRMRLSSEIGKAAVWL